MPKISYKITNMEKWLHAVAEPDRFMMLLGQNMRKASELNGKVAERYMRKVIQAGEYVQPNADLTILIKRSSKPLVDHAMLFKGITSRVVNDYTVFAGVARTDQQSYDIARVVHEGVVINVTPAMRGMFMALYKVSMGEMDPDKLEGRARELYSRMTTGWMPLRPDTSVIVIPPRPWATFVFQIPEFRAKVTANWRAALAKTYRDCAKQ
jgi:hypothetical protein